VWNVKVLNCCTVCIESSADWLTSSRDYRVSAAGHTSQASKEDDDEDDDDDDDDDGEEILRRVLVAGGLRPSSVAGSLRRTDVELMEDQEYVTSAAGAGELSSLRDKVRFTLQCSFKSGNVAPRLNYKSVVEGGQFFCLIWQPSNVR